MRVMEQRILAIEAALAQSPGSVRHSVAVSVSHLFQLSLMPCVFNRYCCSIVVFLICSSRAGESLTRCRTLRRKPQQPHSHHRVQHRAAAAAAATPRLPLARGAQRDSIQSERRRSLVRRDSTFTLSPETSPVAPSPHVGCGGHEHRQSDVCLSLFCCFVAVRLLLCLSCVFHLFGL